MGVDGTLDSCTVSSVVPAGAVPLPDGRRELCSPSSYAVFTGDTRPSSGLAEDRFVDMLARDSVVASERLEVLLPSDGLLEPFVIELRRLEVRGGGILERSGSETSIFLSATAGLWRSGLLSCANAFCTAAGDRVEETVVGLDAGAAPLTPRLGLGLALFLCREKERAELVGWLLLTTREVMRTGEGSREELVELFAEADADRLTGVDSRGPKAIDELFKRERPLLVSLSIAGLLRPFLGDELAREDFWVCLLAGVDDSLAGIASARGERRGTRRQCECDHPSRMRWSPNACVVGREGTMQRQSRQSVKGVGVTVNWRIIMRRRPKGSRSRRELFG